MATESATAKDSEFLLVSLLPDVCFTPKKPPHGVPVPYPLVHDMGKSQQCSPNVFFRGKPAYLHDESYVNKVLGDQAGMGKGVVQPQPAAQQEFLCQRSGGGAYRRYGADESGRAGRGWQGR